MTSSEERVAELGKLLKAKIRIEWVRSGDTVRVSSGSARRSLPGAF